MPSLWKWFGRERRRDVPQPSWSEVLASADEQAAASAYWQGIDAALGRRGIDKVRAHAALRLVVAYVVCDRASAAVMRSAAVDAQAWPVQVAASQLAAQLERDLGLTAGRHLA
jgi:hypothetical protein